MRKWPYLSPGASNPKNKDTFFSSTLNFEEKKVPLFFGLEAPGLRYGLFLIFMITKTQCRTKKMKMLGHPFLMSYRRNKICFGMLMTPVMRIAWVLIQISYFDFFETVYCTLIPIILEIAGRLKVTGKGLKPPVLATS